MMEGKKKKLRRDFFFGLAGVIAFLGLDVLDAYVHRNHGGVPKKDFYSNLGDDVQFLKQKIER